MQYQIGRDLLAIIVRCKWCDHVDNAASMIVHCEDRHANEWMLAHALDGSVVFERVSVE